MSLAKRIKDRLEEIGEDAKWLAKKTQISVTTIYELMNGRIRGSTRLPAIAAALGMHGLWLLDGTGPRLLSEHRKTDPIDGYWPFTVDRKQIEKLSPRDLAVIDAGLRAMLAATGSGEGTSSKKA